ncbi:hypothetical protein [Burkholderia sp. 22PA0106]|uniref:hypothetical protein n=1 Tax=Burkholderia sp. 22PA0106 TaxID=3237371 RepID=UPI0039C2A13B
MAIFPRIAASQRKIFFPSFAAVFARDALRRACREARPCLALGTIPNALPLKAFQAIWFAILIIRFGMIEHRQPVAHAA